MPGLSSTSVSKISSVKAVLAALFARRIRDGDVRIATDSCYWCMEGEVRAAMPGRPSPPSPRFGSVRPCWLPCLRVARETNTAGKRTEGSVTLLSLKLVLR
ncbi:hypothetical protein EJ02DRAFT_164287 [Clathrospora elynae]|uniref:Uncharacterized protein n=1 Tax=Clathrospora elynae TaxID=706981 RepID=A0A6A5S4V5_9PLEO|nr:hypothetical protein EJ02DRAFT_164287 [Clathrospora elynae]